MGLKAGLWAGVIGNNQTTTRTLVFKERGKGRVSQCILLIVSVLRLTRVDRCRSV